MFHVLSEQNSKQEVELTKGGAVSGKRGLCLAFLLDLIFKSKKRILKNIKDINV